MHPILLFDTNRWTQWSEKFCWYLQTFHFLNFSAASWQHPIFIRISTSLTLLYPFIWHYCCMMCSLYLVIDLSIDCYSLGLLFCPDQVEKKGCFLLTEISPRIFLATKWINMNLGNSEQCKIVNFLEVDAILSQDFKTRTKISIIF